MRLTLVGCLIATTLASAGCYSMKPVTIDEVGPLRPSRIWVTRGNEIVEVLGPRVFGDTLVGYVNGTFEEIPAASVKHVTMLKRSRGKTVALVAGTTVGVAAFAILLSGTGVFSDPRQFVDCDDDPERPECQ
jgi:hypothetical protein